MKKSDLNSNDVLHFLGIIFLEIGATENIKKANILADVAHNVPSMVAAGHPCSEIFEKILEVSKRHECEKTIEGYLKTAIGFSKNRQHKP